MLGIEHILVGIDHLLFAVVAVMGLLRYGAGISRDSTVFLLAERVAVYLVGVLASYWLIERGLAVLPAAA